MIATARNQSEPRSSHRWKTLGARVAMTGLLAIPAAALTSTPAEAAGRTSKVTCRSNSWVKSVQWTQGAGGHWRLEVDPTTTARTIGRFNANSIWSQITACYPVPFATSPVQLGTENGVTAYNQMLCHAMFSAGAFGFYTGGATWGLESDRRPINPGLSTYISTQCNWGSSQF